MKLIDLDKMDSIGLITENCDVMYFNRKDIKYLQFGDVTYTYDMMNNIQEYVCETKHCKHFVIEVKEKALRQHCPLSDKCTYKQALKWRNITGVYLYAKNENTEYDYVLVPWEDDGNEFTNKLIKTKYDDWSKTVTIEIKEN